MKNEIEKLEEMMPKGEDFNDNDLIEVAVKMYTDPECRNLVSGLIGEGMAYFIAKQKGAKFEKGTAFLTPIGLMKITTPLKEAIKTMVDAFDMTIRENAKMHKLEYDDAKRVFMGEFYYLIGFYTIVHAMLKDKVIEPTKENTSGKLPEDILIQTVALVTLVEDEFESRGSNARKK